MAEYLSMLQDYVMQHLEMVLLIIVALLLVTSMAFIAVNIKLSAAIKRYRELARGMDNVNLEELLDEYMSSLKDVCCEMEELSQKVRGLELEGGKAIKKVYCQRYDAFPGSGGELSFSVSFLNQENSGVVLTSIYGRDENRVYLKPVTQGNCRYNLSPEEKEVIEKAKIG